MWDAAKGVLWGKFIALNVCTRKERYKINNLSFYHRKLEKEEQYKPKESRGEEIIKIKAEISEIANRNNWQIQRVKI